MTPSELLQEAKSEPRERDLSLYAETIWELRRKNKSYRQIAAFLNERGITTDHMAVYRFVAADNPLWGYLDGRFLVGDIEYEARRGRPVRPFNCGLFVKIEKRLRLVPLQLALGRISTWCEAQFSLSAVPNHCWLEQLCKRLRITWNPEPPHNVKAQTGFELKFEGTTMAMVCRTGNLEQFVRELEAAVTETTSFFVNDKASTTPAIALRERQRRESLEALIIPQGSSSDEEFEGSMAWSAKEVDRLTARFMAIPSQ